MVQELRVVEGGIRLDRFVARSFPGYSRAHVKDLISDGCVEVDGARRPADWRLSEGESVRVRLPVGKWSGPTLKSMICYEDAWILALNKPPGLIVHPVGSSWLQRPEAMLAGDEPNVAALLLLERPEIARSGAARCGLVHRLDRGTSGIMIVSKTLEAQEAVSGAFAAREVEKTYRAVVAGRMARDVSVEAPVGRGRKGGKIEVSPYGRASATEFGVIERGGRATLIEARPLTGRTHQIRAHLAHIGHPVAGDPEWPGKGEIPRAPRLMLHAFSVSLAHPRSGKRIRFTAPVPKDFRDYWRSVGG